MILNCLQSTWSAAMAPRHPWGITSVDTKPQIDLPSVEEHYVASGRQVLPLAGVADLEPRGTLRVAHAPLMRVP